MQSRIRSRDNHF